jgi:hypothetical protein
LSLRPRMRASPLLDVEGYARSAERAYRVLWRDACPNIGESKN